MEDVSLKCQNLSALFDWLTGPNHEPSHMIFPPAGRRHHPQSRALRAHESRMLWVMWVRYRWVISQTAHVCDDLPGSGKKSTAAEWRSGGEDQMEGEREGERTRRRRHERRCWFTRRGFHGSNRGIQRGQLEDRAGRKDKRKTSGGGRVGGGGVITMGRRRMRTGYSKEEKELEDTEEWLWWGREAVGRGGCEGGEGVMFRKKRRSIDCRSREEEQL